MRLKGCRQEEWLEGCGAARSGRRGVGRVELFGFGAGDDRTANSGQRSGQWWRMGDGCSEQRCCSSSRGGGDGFKSVRRR